MKKGKLANSNKKIVPFPYRYYFWPVVAIAITGLFSSAYLAFSHYRNYVDIGYQSFCAISQAFNCDTVSQSPYSLLFDVPVAVWGVMGYGFFLFLLGLAWPSNNGNKRMWTLLMIMAAGFSAYSIYLAHLSASKIQSYCIVCILTYAVSFSLLFYTWLIRKRFQIEPFIKALQQDILFLFAFPKTSVFAMSGFAGVAIAMIIAFPPYWVLSAPDMPKSVSTGVTENGHPWIGAEDPRLTIAEFSDYRCFQCKKMHYYLRKLVNANPDDLRLVHRHFPMDHTINPLVEVPFHQGAAKFAVISLFALERGVFWEMNDLLFTVPRDASEINIRYFAQETGLEPEEIRNALQNRELWNKLKRDILDGLRYELNGTPGFVINGNVYLAHIPPEILRPYMK